MWIVLNWSKETGFSHLIIHIVISNSWLQIWNLTFESLLKDIFPLSVSLLVSLSTEVERMKENVKRASTFCVLHFQRKTEKTIGIFSWFLCPFFTLFSSSNLYFLTDFIVSIHRRLYFTFSLKLCHLPFSLIITKEKKNIWKKRGDTKRGKVNWIIELVLCCASFVWHNLSLLPTQLHR